MARRDKVFEDFTTLDDRRLRNGAGSAPRGRSRPSKAQLERLLATINAVTREETRERRWRRWRAKARRRETKGCRARLAALEAELGEKGELRAA